MTSRWPVLGRVGVILCAAASIVAWVSAVPAAAASSVPTVHVSTGFAHVGELVQVTGSGWSPVGQTVQIQLCGQEARNLSNDCDQASQYTAAIRDGGVFYGALDVRLPPSPCPCVVAVTNEGGFSAVEAPITIFGARTVALPPQIAPPPSVALSAKVLTSVSASAWFGGPRSVTLELRVKNLSQIAFGSPTLTVNVGRGRNPSGFVVGEPLAPLAVGATQVLRIPVTLPAFTAGGYSVRAEVITGQGEVATVVGTSSYPWGLFVVAALLLQGLLLLARNRVRARLRRSTDFGVPAEETGSDAVHVPVSVIDLRAPDAEMPSPQVSHEGEPEPGMVPSAEVSTVGMSAYGSVAVSGPEPIPAIDLRSPSRPLVAAGTTTSRLALVLPDGSLTWTVEVSSFPAIEIQKTSVRAWADFAASPWDALYEGSSLRNLAAESPSNALVAAESFHYESHGLALELTISAVGPRLPLGPDRVVVPVRVEGSFSLGGVRTPVGIETTLEHLRHVESTGDGGSENFESHAEPITYGHTGGGDSFYLQVGSGRAPFGWILRGGLAANVVFGERRIEELVGPYPRRVVLDLRDEFGRRVHATGTMSNGMASRKDDHLLLACRTEWTIDGAPAVGEDRSLVDIDSWRRATRLGWLELSDTYS